MTSFTARARMAKKIRTAVVYRPAARDLKPENEKINYLPGDEPQFEICEFSDGRVAQRWLAGAGSCVWWDSWDDLCSVHISAHPEYQTRVEWSDGTVEYL